MSDRFRPIPMEQLTAWIASELEAEGSVCGLPRELFFVPAADDAFTTSAYGQPLDSPFGVAAGPHSQMAQNIVVAWLCGARFIELKTVQTLDNLDITKPCIDMRDEGYNIEWSQELSIQESFDEYLRAWVLIHALHRRLGFPGDRPGVVFNISVGYDLAGILKPNMQWFLDRVLGAEAELERTVATVTRFMPEVEDIEIPSRLSDNVTLSTMHGCPPEEISKIAAYLLDEWGLHTTVKLNPTLLGPERVRHILSDVLGYSHVTVPDQAFAHDLEYAAATDLVTDLLGAAAGHGLEFSVKLSNTLEVIHSGEVFAPDEKTMYLSGRPLHALTVNLAHLLCEDFEGELAMSFAGGADAHNAPALVAAGMSTVTTCSDLLRPGGYTRLLQYLENTAHAMAAVGAADIPHFVCSTDPGSRAHDTTPEHVRACARRNLHRYARQVLDDPSLHRDTFDRSATKTDRALGLFDCIMAPCEDECPITQKVPLYMRLVEERRFDEAAAVTREDNPLAAILGRACTHYCENPCVRTHYDHPLAIREIKRFIMDHAGSPPQQPPDQRRDAAVGIIGGGPCGLSAAYFLARAGYPVTVFEQRPYSGGMVSGTIPGFRASAAVINQDLDLIASLGVEIRSGTRASLAALRNQGFRYIVVAAGAQRGTRLGVDGEDCDGVLDGLEFLRAARHADPPPLGARVGVIGGGDVAMDCARTARRLSDGEVQVVYRRTIDQMPAQAEEIEALHEEGIGITELAAPQRVVVENTAVVGLECTRMRLGDEDASGRRRPLPIPGAGVTIPLDTVIVAIGQQPDLELLAGESITLTRGGYVDVDPKTMETSIPGVFAGGDVVLNGPATIVEACADGQRIATAIRCREESPEPAAPPLREVDTVELLRRRARREIRVEIPFTPLDERDGFKEIVCTLSEEAAVREASRCLACDQMCSTCATVCPNRAIVTLRCPPLTATLPVVRVDDGALTSCGEQPFEVAQLLQVVVLTDLCNECGDCVTFCPTAGQPYRDKPRLYLDRSEFEAESDNAFMVFSDDAGWTVLGRFGGALHELAVEGRLRYRSPRIEASFDADTLELMDAHVLGEAADGDIVTLDECATMYALLRCVSASVAALPTGADTVRPT